MKDKEITIDYLNIEDVAVKYYIIDLEILFSRTPFLTQNAEGFSYVKPNSSTALKLDQALKEYKFQIPEEYRTKNILIELNAGVIQRLITYFSTSLKLQIFENYGELKVTNEENKALPQVYVKIFTKKKNGNVVFYKDGYTDIRGRFDYVSLNDSKLSDISKFAIFVMSDKYGSLIKECSPPSITIKPEEDLGEVKAKLITYYNKTQQII